MSKKILITGGSGLLGSYLIRWFLQQGYTQITSTYTNTLDTVAPDLRDAVEWKQLALPDKMAAFDICLLYTSPSPRDRTRSRMPSSA